MVDDDEIELRIDGYCGEDAMVQQVFIDTTRSTARQSIKGGATLLFKQSRYFIASKDPEVLRALLRDPVIAEAKMMMPEDTTTNFSSNYRWYPDGSMEPNDDEEDDEGTVAFQIKRDLLTTVRQQADMMGYPLVMEYDYKSDKSNPDLQGIHLKATTRVRRYQAEALSRMLGNGRARSGIVVLPCGAGKTLTGITAAQTIRKSVLVLAPNTTSVYQWKDQFRLFTNIAEQKVSVFTADHNNKDILIRCLGDKNEACVLITTYQMISFGGKRATDTQEIMSKIADRQWGLLLLDETHVVPARNYRVAVQAINAHCRLGLTATLVREDNLITDLNFLVGPKLYEANWTDLASQGYLANVQCVEVWCPMKGIFWEEYKKATAPDNTNTNNNHNRRQQLLYSMNPGKIQPVEFLVRFHEDRGDKIIVFSDSLFCLHYYARLLQRPYIYGATKEWERQAVLSTFRRPTNEVQTICLSQVGDAAIDLPRANVIIQVSSHFGARRQEAQRLGRILRPKSSKADDRTNTTASFDAYFYTLVTPDTKEMSFSGKRQQYLVDQGYTFKVIRNLQDVAATATTKDGYVYRYSGTPEEEKELIQSVLDDTLNFEHSSD